MTTSNVVIDLSHFNTVTSFETVKADGIVGVFHKATQGTTMLDPKYHSRKIEALAAGLWWGAYHFGVGGDGVAQAKYFLSIVTPGPNDLLVLDLEENPRGASMTLAEAEDFVKYVEAETGRWPGLYGGSYVTELLGKNKETALSFCWLWLPEYGPTPRIPPVWDRWTMWQYTDGQVGPEPHTVNGVGKCDRDQFNGTIEELRQLWGYAAANAADVADTTDAPPAQAS
jgi:lysozyme